MNRVFSVRSITIVSVFLLAALATLLVGRVVLAAGEAFTSPTDKTLYEGQNLQITDLQVNGTGDDTLNMILNASNGTLQFNDSTGLTFDGPSSGTNIQFSGTRTAINTALSTLRYYADAPGEHTVEATLGDGNYWAENGHVYTVVADAGISWQDAKEAAEAAQYGGVNGYLATITSQGEHDFILERINDSGWIGANDIASEGVWRWQTGPEAGQQFWTGDDESGSAFNGAFTNWNDGEPNNSGDSENCGQIWFTQGSAGQWNDLDCDSIENQYYVVEFGQDDALPMVASTDFQVTVTAAPEIAFTDLSPADNSEVNSVNALSITFNQPMSISEGYIRVHKASDDSVVAEVWNGTTDDDRTFVFALPQSLQPGNEYYVTVSDSFMQGLVDYYHGFDSKTTWNFSVVDGDGIPDAVEDAAPNSGDGNNDGILDSNQANVASFIDPVTNKYAVLEVDSVCVITDVSVIAEPTTDDSLYLYPAGLMDFVIDCGTPGYVSTVNQYYYGVSNSGFIVRKYNPATKTYASINTATVAQSFIDGSVVTKASYQVKDGGPLDLDGQENGEIVDPAGLAALIAGTPDTGFQRLVQPAIALLSLLTIVLAGFGLLTRYVLRKS